MDEHFNINPDVVESEESAPRRDPFADEWGGVDYVNDAFKLNLNKLIHLAPYSEILLVSGAAGIGKSTLLQQFVVNAKKSWKVVHVRASSLMTAEEFLRQVVHGFGLPAAGLDEIEDMLVEIGRHLQALGRSGRRAIVVIDDAHLLTDELMVMVENILRDERSTNAISLVLGVADEAGGRLDSFPALLHKVAYTLRLEPLAEHDVAGYIHHRLAHSSNLALEPRFSAALIRQFHHKSGGLPGKINELARRQLGKKGGFQGAALPGDGRKLVRWGAALVGIAAVGAILLFQDRINQLVETPHKGGEVVTELALPAVGETAVVTEGVAPQMAAGEDSAAVTPALNMGELVERAETLAAAPEAIPAPASTPVPEAAQPTPETRVAPKPAAAAPITPVPPVAPVAPPKPAPVPAEKPAEPAPAKPAVQPAGRTPEKPKEKAKEKEESKGWLQSQNPQHFTLQLMALLDEAEVRRFVKSHKLEGRSEIFAITRKGNRLTALVYGSYPDRAAVDEAAKALPKEWGVKDPWVRTFASVLEEAKTN